MPLYVTSVNQALTRLRGIIKYPVQAYDYNYDDSLQARLTEAAGEVVIHRQFQGQHSLALKINSPYL